MGVLYVCMFNVVRLSMYIILGDKSYSLLNIIYIPKVLDINFWQTSINRDFVFLFLGLFPNNTLAAYVLDIISSIFQLSVCVCVYVCFHALLVYIFCIFHIIIISGELSYIDLIFLKFN
jgi:hypothetical protein